MIFAMEESHRNVKPLASELETQQKRVRHLRTVVARNLELNEDITQKKAFFTINCIKSNKVIYTSENVKLTQNPSWKGFNLAVKFHDDEKSLMMTSFIIRLWLDHADRKSLLIDWTVDLTGLIYIGEKVQYDGCTYPSNSLLFAMHDGFYGASPEENSDVKYRSIDAQQCSSRVDTSLTRHSYTTGSLLRIQTVLRAIKQTQAVVNKVRFSIEENLNHSQHTAKKLSEREILLLRVNQLRSDLEWRTMQLQSEKEEFEIQQTSFNTRANEITNKFETLQNDKDRHQEKRKSYFEMREDLIKTSAQLVMRRKQLISELAFIYPICEIEGDFSISAVKLPNSEAFSGQDEVMIAVALGNTSHLIQMISHFLDVPVRYPMEQRGSRSRIRDHIHDKLTDKERDFPLYSKGKEKFQFNYGVYLMNKNIAQLRYYCGLGTTDLRITLPNLKSLLELRLGVKFDSDSGTLVLDEGHAGTGTLDDGHAQNLESIHPSKIEAQENTEDTSFEILVKNESPRKTAEEIFTPTHDNFFHVKPSASASSLTNVITTMIDGESDLAIADKSDIGVQLDAQTDNMCFMQGETQSMQSEPSFAPLSMDDPTFIVNNTYQNNYESSQKELPSAEEATFKTSAMHTQGTEDQNLTIKETNIQERTARLTNVSTFKHGAVLHHSEPYEE